jgi:hypothetical protein
VCIRTGTYGAEYLRRFQQVIKLGIRLYRMPTLLGQAHTQGPVYRSH